MGKIEEYEKFLIPYTRQYGNKTVILYQIGNFHELYGVDNSMEKIGNVSEIADILNIKETRVKTKILENNRQNPQMAGFNSVVLDEKVEKLVSFGYTVVVVNQVPETDPVERRVAYVQSPSTSINLNNAQDPYLVSIYMDRHRNKSTGAWYSYIGMASMDITTGQACYYESNSIPSDPTLAEDNLTRFLQSFNPVEVVFNHSVRDHKFHDLVISKLP